MRKPVRRGGHRESPHGGGRRQFRSACRGIGIERLESALLLRSRVVDQLANVLVEAAHFSDIGSIDLNSEQFVVILEDVFRNLDSMPAHPGVQDLRTSIDTMRDIGVGGNSIFAQRQSEISDRKYARDLQVESQAIADSLTLIAFNLVDGAEASTYKADENPNIPGAR